MPRLVAGTVIDGLFLLIACVTVNEEIKEDPPNGAMPLPSRPGADALTVFYFELARVLCPIEGNC